MRPIKAMRNRVYLYREQLPTKKVMILAERYLKKKGLRVVLGVDDIDN